MSFEIETSIIIKIQLQAPKSVNKKTDRTWTLFGQVDHLCFDQLLQICFYVNVFILLCTVACAPMSFWAQMRSVPQYEMMHLMTKLLQLHEMKHELEHDIAYFYCITVVTNFLAVSTLTLKCITISIKYLIPALV